MIEICLESGQNTLHELRYQRQKLERSHDKLGEILRNMGMNDSLVDKLVYKDKLNICLIWSLGSITIILLFFIVYLI